MKKIIFLVLSLSLLTSCISFYDVQGVNQRLIPTTQEVYHNGVDSYKKGEACVLNILYLVAIGDSSIETAAQNANITKISSISTKYKHFWFYLPFFQEGCTVVTGE